MNLEQHRARLRAITRKGVRSETGIVYYWHLVRLGWGFVAALKAGHAVEVKLLPKISITSRCKPLRTKASPAAVYPTPSPGYVEFEK